MTTTLDPRLRVWRQRVFAATWLSYAGLYFCRRPFYVVKPALGQELHWSATTLGYLGSAYLVAYTIGQFVAGASGQRFGPRVVVLIGMMGSLIVNVAFGMTNSLATFAVFMWLNGMAQATGWSANCGTMAEWFHRSERGRVMGLWTTNFQVGGILASNMTAWVLGAYGFRYAFFAGAMVLLAVWVFFLFNQRNSPADLGLSPVVEPEPATASEAQSTALPQNSAPDCWTPRIITNLLLVCMFYFFIKFIRYAVWSWAPYLLNLHYGMKKDQAGYLSTVFDLAGVAGAIAVGYASDRFFRSRRVPACFVSVMAMMCACLLLYLLADKSLVAFAVCLGLIGFFLFGPDTLMTGAGAIEVAPRGSATLSVGIINGMGSLGPLLQELVLGKLFDTAGVTPVFATLLACSFMSAVALWRLMLRSRAGLSDL